MRSATPCTCESLNLSLPPSLPPLPSLPLHLPIPPTPSYIPFFTPPLTVPVLVRSQNVTQHGILTRCGCEWTCGCGWTCGYTGGHWGGQWNRARMRAEQLLLFLIVKQSRVAIVTIATKATLFPFFIDNTVSHATFTKQEFR